jgi:peptide/nickel transport system substrate-binding protein
MKSRVLVVLALFVGGLLVLGCGAPPQTGINNNGSQTSEQLVNGQGGGSITHRVTTPIKTLNYLVADDEPSVLLTLFLMNDRLVALDHREQKYVPSLAESYTIAPDGLTLDVTLRDGLKFSDGAPLTSKDVDFSLRAVYDKRTNSPVFRDSLLIGGKEIAAKVVDERKLQLILPEKVASVENYLENLAILPEHVLRKGYSSGKLGEAWKITDDPASIVTSGPFSVESVSPGERVKLKKNQHYWKRDSAGTALPYLDSITLEVVADANNAIARLQQNSLDIADRIRTSDYAALKSGGGQVRAIDAGPGLATDHLWFNLNTAKKSGESLEGLPKHKWFSDVRFRQAVAHAVDRKSIATNTLQGLATPLLGFVAAGNRAWLNTEAPKADYDPGRAAALLAEAGFTVREADGKQELSDKDNNRVEFTLLVPAENEPRKQMAAVIQEDLAKLGIVVQVAPIDFQGLTERWTTTFDYDAILLGVSLTAIDPSSYASFLPSDGSAHQWRPKQAQPATEWETRVNELFKQQAQETDVEARKKTFNEIQVIMGQEMPVVPIVSRHIVSAVNERIGNHSPSGILPFSLWNADRLFIKK